MSGTCSQSKQIIFKVYKFFKDLSKQNKINPVFFVQSLKITDEICGISERTVRHICQEGRDRLENATDENNENDALTAFRGDATRRSTHFKKTFGHTLFNLLSSFTHEFIRHL